MADGDVKVIYKEFTIADLTAGSTVAAFLAVEFVVANFDPPTSDVVFFDRTGSNSGKCGLWSKPCTQYKFDYCLHEWTSKC